MGNQQSNKRKEKAKQTNNSHHAKKCKKKNKKNAMPTEDGIALTPSSNNPLVISSPAPPPPGDKFPADQKLNLKIYPSYASGKSELEDGNPDDIKVYRSNKDRLLQRKSATVPAFHSSAVRDYPELGRRGLRWDSLSETRSSARASSTGSPKSTIPKVAKEDFPSSIAIRQRSNHFEHTFIESLTQKFGSLPCKVQLASLSIAIRPFTAHQAVSLFSYLKSQTVPVDLRPASTTTTGRDPPEYILTIPTALFLDVKRIREERVSDPDVLATAARDIVTCIVGEVANEISRMFEYQIALLNEETSVALLADHAADCVIEYAVKRSHRLLDRNTVVQGVVRGQPKIGKAQFISVIIGSQELKWDLSKILKKPGLRKDVLLYTDSLTGSNNGHPWTFHSSPETCDPQLYGYRGLMIEWDFQNEVYRVNSQDQRTLLAAADDPEVPWRMDDFHRLYTPYQCLVGAAVMSSCKTVNLGAGDDETLAEYMLGLLGSADNCGEIQPVYRPLSRRCIRMAAIKRAPLLEQTKADNNRTTVCLKSDAICNDLGPKDLPNGLRRVQPLPPRSIEEDTVRTNRLPVRQSICAAAAEEADEEEDATGLPPSVAMTTAMPDIRDIDDGEPVVVERKVTANTSNCEPKERDKLWAMDDDDVLINKDEFKFKETKDGKDVDKNNRTEEKWNRKTVIQAENENKAKNREDKNRKNSIDILNAESLIKTGADELTNKSTDPSFLLIDHCSGSQHRISNLAPFVESAIPKSRTFVVNHLGSNKKAEEILRGSSSVECGDGEKIVPVRKAAMYVEMKEGIRCKILQALEVLRVEPISSQLPDAKLFGRKTQVCHLTEMLAPAGSMVTITGCYGIGKSSVALAIGHNLKTKSITSVFINCRGCCSMASFVRRLVGQFGLHFRLDERTSFYNWLNCHDQQLLIILDNVDLPEEDNEALSYVTDDLLHAVPKLRIVCTRIHPFYQGKVSSGRRTYRLGDIRETSDGLFLRIAPDLRDKDIQMLSSLCCYIPFAIQLVGNVLAFEEDLDPRNLVRSLSSSSHPALPSIETDIRELTRDECERKQLRSLTLCVVAVLDNIGEIYTEILCKMSCFASGFDSDEAADAVHHKRDLVADALRSLSRLGLLVRGDSRDGGRYHLPPAVRLVCRNLMVDDGVVEALYCIRVLEKLKNACDQYGSSDYRVAMATVERDYDNVTDSLRRVTESESVYEAAWSLASLEGAVFLSEFLTEDVYCGFFEMLERAADTGDDPLRRCQALCCLAFYHAAQGKVGHAAFAASKAYEISGSVNEVDRAFCFYCLAKVYWYDEEEHRKALMLAKRAVDLFQEFTGPLDIRTLYACELYGWMLTSAGHLQTARHVYNISDEAAAVVEGHPQMLAGYGCRRLIWDELGLFERAKQMAVKGSRLTQWMYGQHPATGIALMQLCEATVKRGSLSDAICLCIHALAVRIKVLGPSFETGLTYKTLSSLMLRQTQYEGAAAFGQRALEIFERTGSADGDLIVDIKDIINQSRLKLARSQHHHQQQQQSKMLQVDAATTKDLANKKNVTFQELVRSTEWPQSKSSAEV